MEASVYVKGELTDMAPDGKGRVHGLHDAFSGLIGFQTEFLTMTSVVLVLLVRSLRPLQRRYHWSATTVFLAQAAAGESSYLRSILPSARGRLFTEHTDEVYEDPSNRYSQPFKRLTVNCI